MLMLTGVNFFKVRSDTYQTLDAEMRQLADSRAENIAEWVREIRQASESVKVSSNEIAVGNLDLSNRTQQQAGSLEETASAMDRLTSTVKQNAGNARAASQLAMSASDIATEGGTVVGRVDMQRWRPRAGEQGRRIG